VTQRDRAGDRSRPGPAPRPKSRSAPRVPGPAGADLAAQRGRITAVVAPVVAAAGLDLEDLAVSRVGRRYLVRVTVDGDGGVSLDAVADLSRDISVALDAAEAAQGEFTTGEYVLEVSSPGTDRPLTQPRHWRRNIGRLVAVSVSGRPATARITAADDDGVVLEVAGARRGHPYAELGPGRVQVEFSRLAELDEDDLVEFPDPDDATADGADPGGADPDGTALAEERKEDEE